MLHPPLTVLLRPPLALGVLDLAVVLLVELVPDEHEHEVLARERPRVLQPPVERLERRALRNVVDEDGACCAAVVRARDGAEAFLARRVPELASAGVTAVTVTPGSARLLTSPSERAPL
jgi:hypothetical protein